MSKASKTNFAKTPRRSSSRDALIGRLIRERRQCQGMSQAALGACLGVTFQQIQKYESGANRVSASRIGDIARVLDVPISWFFGASDRDRADCCVLASRVEASDRQQEADQLLRAYNSIGDPVLRKRVRQLVKSMAGSH